MKLKSVEFYQSVRLWNNQEKKTIDASEKLGVELVDHLVILSWPEQEDIIVPTANMRHGRREKPATFDPGYDPAGIYNGGIPKTPAGKLQAIDEMIQDGELTAKEAIEALNAREIKKASKGKKTK